ncbi:transcription termination/antitermination protein NusG [bacterium]|nr:transcription termination/antitermination protein NusG [bacterium]MBU1752890.1 transcription termination/antitermination protein NusG [bacterium]
MAWYVIHTYSGYENKVKLNLENRLEAMNLSDKVSQIVIPTVEVTEVKGGKKATVAKKFFPGYILIEMELSDDTWYVVKHTPGIFGFVGDKNKPMPLSQAEVDTILKQISAGAPKLKPRIQFQKDEAIRVIEGPFKNFIGTVGEIDAKHGKLRVMMNILGRITPVEVEFCQVEKM